MRSAAAALVVTLAAGCGLLPGGDGEASTQPQPAAPPTTAAEPTPVTAASPLQSIGQALLGGAQQTDAGGIEEIVEEAAQEVLDAVAAADPSAADPAAPAEPAEPSAAHRDPTECAEAAHGSWRITRIRDGSCVGYVDGGPTTVFGLVCRWTGQRQHAMDVFAILPPLDPSDDIVEILDLQVRHWVFPLQVYGPDQGPDDESAGWWPWTEFAPKPHPWTEAEEGLLLGILDSASAVDAAASAANAEAQDSAETAAESPDESEAGDDASAAPAESASGMHPRRVVFAPGDLVESLIGGQTSVLARFGDETARRYGRPFELGLEAKFDVLRQQSPEEDEEDAEAEGEDAPSEPQDPVRVSLDPIRVFFPLNGAAQALRIAQDDCGRLNRDAQFDSESESHLLDGFAPARPPAL